MWCEIIMTDWCGVVCVKIMNALVTETNLVIESGDWSALRPGPRDQKYLSLGHWVMNHWKFLFEHVN